jgi:hypothetical protein
VNPCTGADHTVTISGTVFVHFHDGQVVAHAERTITTEPTAFTGHGTDTFVDNGEIILIRLTDILTNPSGERIQARFVLVVDLSTGTVRVEEGALTCLRSVSPAVSWKRCNSDKEDIVMGSVTTVPVQAGPSDEQLAIMLLAERGTDHGQLGGQLGGVAEQHRSVRGYSVDRSGQQAPDAIGVGRFRDGLTPVLVLPVL